WDPDARALARKVARGARHDTRLDHPRNYRRVTLPPGAETTRSGQRDRVHRDPVLHAVLGGDETVAVGALGIAGDRTRTGVLDRRLGCLDRRVGRSAALVA